MDDYMSARDKESRPEDFYERLNIPRGTLLWKACERLPCGYVRPHVVRSGNHLFIGGGYTGKMQHSRTVFTYDLSTGSWSTLETISPCHSFGLTVINDMVTIVGGVNVVTSLDTNILYSYKKVGGSGKWCMCLPPMLKNRSCHSVTKVGNIVFVIGGVDGNSRSYLSNTEILDLDVENKQWLMAPSLPFGVSFMCLAASKTSLFVAGGLLESGPLHEMLTCDIQTLVAKAQLGVMKSNGDDDSSVWKKLNNKLPNVRSGCVVVQDKVVTFGGIQADKCSPLVHYWKPHEKESNMDGSWIKLGLMPFSLSSMSGIAITPNRVMLVGGYTNPRAWTSSLSCEVVEVVNILDSDNA